ncbi:MAG: DUF815 domain-containing protein [Clostridia bacterium]|nr:DUF815 domain-containing protein [Clostridia bacterium]
MSNIQMLALRLHTLTVFRALLGLTLFENFLAYARENDSACKIDRYAEMVCEVYCQGGDLTAAVRKALFENENVYVTALAAGKGVDAHIVASAERELAILSELASLTPSDWKADIGLDIELPLFTSQKVDFAPEYRVRIADIHKHGYGIFASHGMFRLSDSGERSIEPIVSADRITVETFTGYEAERQKVIANTQAFVDGKPAANVLLYGDAGTGKSSTVKAVANQFFDEGVRLIELRKDQMSLLPFVMEKISRNPLKFIIFIDDLSFNRNDDTFSMLKAALEGSASAKASNAVIYATSNRRHIVRECFDEREGSDVHRNDTMQELLSLSARFGLTVRFEKPNKELYLTIVRELAQKKGVTKEVHELEIEAEAFALARGHRSPRCAEQYIDSLL